MRRPMRQFFGWYDPKRKQWRISLYPPDAPVRPSIPFPTRKDLEQYSNRKRGNLMWLPPLTLAQEQMDRETLDRW